LDVPSSSFPSFPSAAHRFGDRDQPEPLVPEVSHEPARLCVVLRLPELFPPQSGFFEKNVRGGKRVKVVKVVPINKVLRKRVRPLSLSRIRREKEKQKNTTLVV
jgi:hypothetical protein